MQVHLGVKIIHLPLATTMNPDLLPGAALMNILARNVFNNVHLVIIRHGNKIRTSLSQYIIYN